MNIHCGPDYPDNPPTFQFVSAVNIPCVDQRTGKVRVDEYHIWEAGGLSDTLLGGPRQAPLPRAMEARVQHGNRPHRVATVGFLHSFSYELSANSWF